MHAEELSMRPFQRKQGPRPEKVKHTATGRRIASAEHSNLRAIPDSSRSGLTEREVRMNARRVRILILVASGRIDEIANLPQFEEADASEDAARRSNPDSSRTAPRAQRLRSRTAHWVPQNGEIVLSADDIEWLVAGNRLRITVSGYESLIIRAGLGGEHDSLT